MAYHHDLIEQARHLIARDQGRPRQVNLRRAVSAAYYALFHFLIDRATQMIVGTAAERQVMRRAVGRAFQHRTMALVSESFSKNQLPPKYAIALGTTVIPQDLLYIAQTFKDLQEKRHEADYNLNQLLRKRDVRLAIDAAERAIQRWDNIANDSIARLYLVGLLCGQQMRE